MYAVIFTFLYPQPIEAKCALTCPSQLAVVVSCRQLYPCIVIVLIEQCV